METTEIKNGPGRRYGGRRHRAGWIMLAIIGFTAFVFLFGAIIMWLWNWLMPVIFHLGMITYWQAVGLAILGRLLFGSFHHGGGHYRGRSKFGMWKRWHHGNYNYNCGDYYGRSKWNYYEDYWKEEGEQAFNDYVKRKSTSKE